MYKIIGGDGKAYGPVSAEQLRAWMAEGRANGQTLTQVEGAVEWRPLSTLPEFGAASPPPVLQPPATPPAPAPGGPPRRNNPLAVAGFICGLLGVACCGPLFASLGLVFSILGLMEIKRHPQQYDGENLAIAGIVLGALGLVVFVLAFLGGLGSDLFHGLRGRHRFVL